MPRSFDSVFYGAAGGGEDLPSDDEFNRVSFLSHFDGANNGVNNAFDDGSADNRTITTAGNMAQGSFGPFARPDGEWAFNNTASTNDSFKVTAHDNFDMTNPFTIEGWIFIPDLAVNKLLFGRENNYWMTHDYQGIGGASGKFGFNYQNSGSWGAINASAATVANTWYFLQATYVGTTVTFYINGVSQGTASVGSPSSNTDKPFYVLSGPGAKYAGTASNVRLSSVARSTSLPTAKFTSDSDTELLVCQSNRFVDNGPDGHTITTTAGASVTSFGPFLTSAVYDAAVNGASAYFNASSAILVASPPSFGPQSWTFECWFYFTGDGTYRVLFAQGPANGTDVSEFYRSSDNKLTFQVATSGANRIIMNTAVNVTSNNEWVHCALTHEYTSSSNSTYKIYQNGILGQTLNHTGGYNWASGAGSGRPIVIGRSEWEGDYNSVPSYVQDSRLVVGSVVYTSNFTPPTAPLTAVTNTKLLLNMADGQAIDSAAQNNLTLVGNANVSTDQAKFGDTSFHVPASGDYLKMPGGTETGNFGTGNFTIEMWLYRTASGATQSIIDSRSAASATDYQTHITSGNKLRSRYGGIAETSATVPVNEWVHIAIVRNNGTVTQYINGTGGGTYSSTASLTVTSSGLTLGGGANDSGSIAGYVDDIRISKMARYTGNFTAPTEPFADKGQ